MLSPEEARLLDRLTLASGQSSPIASSSGVRRARTRGVGAEFHEYRHYQPGDDPRSIDWTVEARLGQLVVRVPRAEGHLALHVLVDVSGSMRVGTPSKLACAAKVAAALAYLAVEGRDAVGLATFSDRLHAYVRPAASRAHLARIFDILRDTAADGSSRLDGALERYAAIANGPGLAVVISDYFNEDGRISGLHALVQRRIAPFVVQIVAREELEPDFDGEAELHDIENPSAPPLVVDRAAIDAYRSRMEHHSQTLRSACASQGFPWLRLAADTRLRDMLIAFETAGMLGL